MNPPPTATPHEGEIWVCYDIPWASGDLSGQGLVRADAMSEAELHTLGVVEVVVIDKYDKQTRRLLGFDDDT